MTLSTGLKSYHIFFCPFILHRGQGEEKSCLESWLDESSGHWNERKYPAAEREISAASDEFMAGQYFNREARDLLQNVDKKGCKRFRYDSDIVARARYVIADGQKNNPCGKAYAYRLPIEKIELFLFRHRVGILQLNVRNDAFPVLEDIQRINDFGRRILLPFMPINEVKGTKNRDGFILCADRLGLELDGDDRLVWSFRDRIDAWERPSDADYRMPDFLYALLAGEFGDNGALERTRKLRDSQKIQSVIDDRMYLCALARSEELGRIAQKWPEVIEDTESSECNEQAKKVYALAFVDPKDATCQNRAMRRRLLEQAVYPRWSDAGTLYAATGSAFLCMTSDDAPWASVVRPFLTEHYLIVALALAQKVSIIDFSQRAAEISDDASSGDSKSLQKEQIDEIIKLQEDYVLWANQEYLLEVTEQEQGMDFYRLLQEQLGHLPHMERLQGQLQGLYSVANVRQGMQQSEKMERQNRKLERQNSKVEKLTKIAGIWAVCAVMMDFSLNMENFFERYKNTEEAAKIVTDSAWQFFSFSNPGLCLLPIGIFLLGVYWMQRNDIPFSFLWKRSDEE